MKASTLTIEAIIIPPSSHPVHTETYLNALSDTEWSELRALATRSRHAGNPALLCGDCGQPVYGRESSNGRRHCYHFGTETKICRWAVRRQGFWDRWRPELREGLAHLVVVITASTHAAHDLCGREPSAVFKTLTTPSHHLAAWTLNQLYLAMPTPDKNWAGDCQTGNFHTRLWEAQLLASLREQGLLVTQPYPSPDFRIENRKGGRAGRGAVLAGRGSFGGPFSNRRFISFSAKLVDAMPVFSAISTQTPSTRRRMTRMPISFVFTCFVTTPYAVPLSLCQASMGGRLPKP